MEAHEFGKENKEKILLIPGNIMSWRQFEDVIPHLEKKYHVIAISTDGYDGTGETTFTTAQASALTVENWFTKKGYDHIRLVFGESFGCATATAMFQNQNISIDSMIVSGPQCIDGILNGFFGSYVAKYQYKLLRKMKSTSKVPWLLNVFTHSDEENMLKMFRAAADHVTLETIQNCDKEALRLFRDIDAYEKRPDAKVGIWYGEKEPNMKKALKILKKIYPASEDHPFAGFGHGDIIGHPELMAQEIEIFFSGGL